MATTFHLGLKKNADSTDSILLLLLQVYNVREKKEEPIH